MNCINCGTELPELVDGMAQCTNCGTIFKKHGTGETDTLVTTFIIGDSERIPTPSELAAFRRALESIEIGSKKNFLIWRGPLTIEQFDVYPDKEKANE